MRGKKNKKLESQVVKESPVVEIVEQKEVQEVAAEHEPTTHVDCLSFARSKGNHTLVNLYHTHRGNGFSPKDALQLALKQTGLIL